MEVLAVRKMTWEGASVVRGCKVGSCAIGEE